MDARFNWIIDNVPLRVALNTVAFALWVAATVGVLEICSKIQ